MVLFQLFHFTALRANQILDDPTWASIQNIQVSERWIMNLTSKDLTRAWKRTDLHHWTHNRHFFKISSCKVSWIPMQSFINAAESMKPVLMEDDSIRRDNGRNGYRIINSSFFIELNLDPMINPIRTFKIMMAMAQRASQILCWENWTESSLTVNVPAIIGRMTKL